MSLYLASCLQFAPPPRTPHKQNNNTTVVLPGLACYTKHPFPKVQP